jgi:hypothetical protein
VILQVQKGSVLHSEPIHGEGISSVVVLDDDGQPIIAIEEIGSGTIHVTRTGEQEFQIALLRLGVKAQAPSTLVSTG